MNKKKGISTMNHSLKKFQHFLQKKKKGCFGKKTTQASISIGQKGRKKLPYLKPTTTTISLRLPTFMINEIKRLAHRQDVAYQSLIKIYLKKLIDKEIGKVI
jgi:predicted DNA binding CopG/RHH family protein